ncbi:MAG: D-alanyl-D-alanine carboxypeptidase [Clostridia bacterium]|nr:D-alanyl-D-alanine carboxypeptidase [Clostridia bacterium]
MKKSIIFITLLTILISTLIIPVHAMNYTPDEPLNCKVDLLINLDSNTTVISKSADAKVAPASLTKIMTALVVLQNCDDLERTVVVGSEALESLYNTGSSLSGLKSGEIISVYNLLCCMLIPSGNDAAMVLACEIGGTAEKFVDMMNAAAAKLGCKNTHFDNPHGLDSATHLTTANDLAVITRAALKYSAFEKIVANATYDLPETNKNKARTLVTTNHMINKTRVSYYYEYCKGIKTGSTDNAGKCLISYASKNGYNYLAVAMGGDYRLNEKEKVEENQAFMDTLKMYKWAFDNLSYEAVAKQDQYVTSVPVNFCWDMDSVRLVSKSEVLALIPKGNDSQSVSFIPLKKPESIDAPFKKGEYVCDADIMFSGVKIGTTKLVVAEDANLSVLLYGKAILKKITANTVFKIIIVLIVLGIVIYILEFIRVNRKRRKSRELKIVKYNELERNSSNKKKKK